MGQLQCFEASREASKSIIALKHHQPQPSPYELQGRQHQHKQKLSLSHQRHGAVLFQLWSASNLTKCQCFMRLDSYKISQMWWQCIGLCNYSGAFFCGNSMGRCRTEAGREEKLIALSVHALLWRKACRCFWVFCQGWTITVASDLREYSGRWHRHGTLCQPGHNCLLCWNGSAGPGDYTCQAPKGPLPRQLHLPSIAPHAGLLAQFSKLDKKYHQIGAKGFEV